MENTYYIYELIDPITKKTRYIGQTNNLKNRYKKHIYDSKKNTYHNCLWIQSLLKKGVKPIMNEIDSTNLETIDILEKMYISLYKSWGCDLTNIYLGGQVNRCMSNETKMKISETLKGKKQSQETKDKRKATLKETWKSPELRELKRKQSIELNRLGLIGTKGRVSSKKGIKLNDDIKLKLKNGLIEYYKNNRNHKYVKIDDNIIKSLLLDFDNKMKQKDIATKYSLNRAKVRSILLENGYKLQRN
jgi:hypothetical protein